MSKVPRLYTKLSRPAAGIGSYKSLWLGSDHLLIVNSTGYTEDYARLRFRDIKGFFMIDSDRRLGWGIFWVILVVATGLPFAITLSKGDTPIFSAFFLLVGLVGLVWNQVLGPGCRAFVVTGVQTAPLPSVVRWAKARRLLIRLEPLILEAQSGLEEKSPGLPGSPPSVA